MLYSLPCLLDLFVFPLYIDAIDLSVGLPLAFFPFSSARCCLFGHAFYLDAISSTTFLESYVGAGAGYVGKFELSLGTNVDKVDY